MPSPNMARGLLTHFPCSTDPPTSDQHVSPAPAQSPTSSSLRAISTAGAGEGGVRDGAGGCRVPRDGGGKGRVTGGGYRDGRGTTRGADGAEREKTAGITTTATVTGGRRHTVDLMERSKDDGEGGEYCAGGRSIEKSAASCSGLVHGCRGDVGGGAPTGPCAPRVIFHAAFFQLPCRHRQRHSGLPRPFCSLSLLLRR